MVLRSMGVEHAKTSDEGGKRRTDPSPQTVTTIDGSRKSFDSGRKANDLL
jgi:hypothetical protein